jgi:hypothetical protein
MTISLFDGAHTGEQFCQVFGHVLSLKQVISGKNTTEPEFVNLLRSRGIDSQPWRVGKKTLFDVPARQDT